MGPATKEDLQTSPDGMVFGDNPLLPDDFASSGKAPFCSSFSQASTTSPQHHRIDNPTPLLAFARIKYVFVRVGPQHPSQQKSDQSSFKVIQPGNKTFKVLMNKAHKLLVSIAETCKRFSVSGTSLIADIILNILLTLICIIILLYVFYYFTVPIVRLVLNTTKYCPFLCINFARPDFGELFFYYNHKNIFISNYFNCQTWSCVSYKIYSFMLDQSFNEDPCYL